MWYLPEETNTQCRWQQSVRVENKRGAIMKLPRFFSCICVAACIFAAGSAQADERGDERGQALVLGDSVAFAYITQAGHEYINPGNFLGFADDLEKMLGVETMDAGCPGET